MNKTAKVGGNQTQNIGEYNFKQQEGGLLHRLKRKLKSLGVNKKLVCRCSGQKLREFVDEEFYHLCVVNSKQDKWRDWRFKETFWKSYYEDKEKTDLGFSEPFKCSTVSMHYCNGNREIFIFKDRKYPIHFTVFFIKK